MLPIRDHSKTLTTPVVTYALLFLNITVFFIMLFMPLGQLDVFIASYALIPSEIVKLKDIHTLMTSMFLHGGFGHIFGNMIFLNVFGDNLEERFGHLGYLVFYLICGIAASSLQILVNPGSSVPNLGASGAIAGLLGAYLVLFPRHKVDVLVPLGLFITRATVPAFTMLLYWIAFQFLHGLGSLAIPQTGGVAYFAHVGGFIAGVVIAWVLQKLHQSGDPAEEGVVIS